MQEVLVTATRTFGEPRNIEAQIAFGKLIEEMQAKEKAEMFHYVDNITGGDAVTVANDELNLVPFEKLFAAGAKLLGLVPFITKGVKWGAKSRGLWKLTSEGASSIKLHSRYGKMYKSESDGLWWAVDNAGHGGSQFKVFKETNKGLEWYKDADEYGDFITGKHKGATGVFISWGELKTIK